MLLCSLNVIVTFSESPKSSRLDLFSTTVAAMTGEIICLCLVVLLDGLLLAMLMGKSAAVS